MAELIEPFASNASADLAGRLIKRFGSIRQVVFASSEQLTEAAEGMDAGLCEKILAARVMFETALREQVERIPTDPSNPAVANYLRSRLCHENTERVWAIFLDAQNGFIADECVGDGDRGHVRVRERQLFARAFELHAFGVILAHNHPSGSPLPSQSDVKVTQQIAALADRLGIAVIDHLIIAGSEVTSMRRGKFL